MAFQALSDHLEKTGKKTQDYLKNTAEYYKLLMFKSTMKISTSLVHALLMGSMFLLFLAFFSVGIAFLLGKLFGSILWGFFAISGIYLSLFFLILFLGKEPIVKFMLSKFSELILEEEDLKEQHFEKETVAPEQILPKDFEELEVKDDE
ncbi:MAG: hypothetical protein HKM28_00625 [Flavobacteriaceae bacterium]|nr:hypothetical protein [Flavobacteriaceae bacterium]